MALMVHKVATGPTSHFRKVVRPQPLGPDVRRSWDSRGVVSGV